MANEKQIEALRKHRESLTEDEKKAMYEKGALTRRKNNHEKQQVRKTLQNALDNAFVVRGQDGKVKNLQGLDAIAYNLVITALEPGGKQVVSAYQTIRDTLGEKPTDKVEQDTTIEIVMSDDMKKLAK